MKQIGIFIITALLFTACSSSDKNDELKRLNYVSSEHGFSLTFPLKWLQYRVFEKMDLIDPDTRVSSLYFTLPTRSRDWQPVYVPDRFARLFTVRIFPVRDWDRFYSRYREKKAGAAGSDVILHRTAEKVYVLIYSNSIPIDLYIYMKDISSIAASFRMLEK